MIPERGNGIAVNGVGEEVAGNRMRAAADQDNLRFRLDIEPLPEYAQSGDRSIGFVTYPPEASVGALAPITVAGLGE